MDTFEFVGKLFGWGFLTLSLVLFAGTMWATFALANIAWEKKRYGFSWLLMFFACGFPLVIFVAAYVGFSWWVSTGWAVLLAFGTASATIAYSAIVSLVYKPKWLVALI